MDKAMHDYKTFDPENIIIDLKFIDQKLNKFLFFTIFILVGLKNDINILAVSVGDIDIDINILKILRLIIIFVIQIYDRFSMAKIMRFVYFTLLKGSLYL